MTISRANEPIAEPVLRAATNRANKQVTPSLEKVQTPLEVSVSS